jgi:hypothetical protein
MALFFIFHHPPQGSLFYRAGFFPSIITRKVPLWADPAKIETTLPKHRRLAAEHRVGFDVSLLQLYDY